MAHPEAVDPALGLSPRLAAGWRRVRGLAVAEGFAADADAMAWRWAVETAGARARTWEATADRPEGHQATVKALEVVEGLIRRTLGIKASPPTYRGIVADLGDFLVGWEATIADAPIHQAARELAELGETRPAGWKAKAATIVDELERTILEDYGENIGETERTAYGRFLAAAFKLGKAETLTPMGWGVSFDLEDQDAIHGLTNSGLWWIGKAYGPQVPRAQLLAVVEQVALRGGLGREAAGEALEAALGSSFTRGPAYWRGLAATVATRSRSFGALSGLQAAGAVTYEYVNPLDERTSDVCRALDGTKFTIRGGIELRDRLLNAPTPEDWKAISPWPKPRDLVGPGGGLLSPAELQAKGIAWPPLHFHCRSSIDVDTWAPISAEDLGPPTVVDPAAPKPPKVAKVPKAKPGKAPAKPADPYARAKARLDRSTAELQALGVPTDRIGIPADLHADVIAHFRAVRAKWKGATPPHVLGGLEYPRTTRDRLTYRALDELIRELEGGSRSLLDGHPTYLGAYFADPALAARAKAVRDAYVRRSVAFREAMELAPAAVRAAERRALVESMIRGLDAVKDTGQRAAIVDAVTEATRVYDEHWLAIMRWDGVAINHVPSESRAYARGAWDLWGEVSTNQDLTDLVRREGSVPPKWIAVTGDTSAAQRAPSTMAHELAHVLDSLASGLGVHGAAWADRLDRKALAKLWKSTLDRPFRRKIVKIKGKALIVELPHETAAKSRHMYAGSWLKDYEARIYNDKPTAPTAEWLEQAAKAIRGEGGPVEFTSMAHQYVQEAGQGLAAAIAEGRASPTGVKLGRLFVRSIDPSGLVTPARPAAMITRSRQLYGLAYRDGLESMHRAGFRYVRDAGLTRADFHGDADALGFAMAVRVTFGTPMAELVGPGGPLAGVLTAAPDVAKLERVAAALDKLDASRAHSGLWYMTAAKVDEDYDLTRGATLDALAAALEASP